MNISLDSKVLFLYSQKYESESEDDDAGSQNSPRLVEQSHEVEIKHEVKYEDQIFSNEVIEENNITIAHEDTPSMEITNSVNLGENESNITITH